MADSVLDKFQILTGWPDAEIGVLIGIAKPTVQAYRCGRLRENLDQRQRDLLMAELRAWRRQTDELMAQIEMLC